MNFQTKAGLHKWVEVSVGVSKPRHFLEGNGRGKKRKLTNILLPRILNNSFDTLVTSGRPLVTFCSREYF